MEVIRDPFSLRRSYAGSAMTIGNFDGVHLGHQRLIAEVVGEARRRNSKAVVFTFHPHPAKLLRPDKAPPRIMTFERKLEVLEQHGVDVVICPGDMLPVLRLTAEDFARRIIAEAIGASIVVEGLKFHFGAGQTGDDDLLRELGEKLGYEVRILEPITLGGETISSTRIRREIIAGRVGEAAEMLGRPFEYVGWVVQGRHVGRQLGFPTINVAGEDFLLPGEGVYCGRAAVRDCHAEDGRLCLYPAAVSVGRAPTFGTLPEAVVEAFLLDFAEDVYGRQVRLEFIQRIRDQQVFASGQELASQLAHDCQVVREVLNRGRTEPGG